MSTIAETIADSLHNDGQTFITSEGKTLESILDEAGINYWDRGDGSRAYVFVDGSIILTADVGWDILTTLDGRWIDSSGEAWATLDDDGEPYGWAYRRCG